MKLLTINELPKPGTLLFAPDKGKNTTHYRHRAIMATPRFNDRGARQMDNEGKNHLHRVSYRWAAFNVLGTCRIDDLASHLVTSHPFTKNMDGSTACVVLQLSAGDDPENKRAAIHMDARGRLFGYKELWRGVPMILPWSWTFLGGYEKGIATRGMNEHSFLQDIT